MRSIPLTFLTLFCAISAFASDIREFDIPTLEKLGNEISRRDAIASRASDLLLETQPAARALKTRGWISELGKDQDKVYWITDTPSGPRLAYIVVFGSSEKPQVEDCRGQELPQKVAVRFAAEVTAKKAVKGKLFNHNYNFEVLEDPDGDGFLVYALAATTEADEVVLAGHSRVTVSADGTKAERVDALSKSLLVQPIKADEGTMALALFQLVSDKPVETIIYTSNLVKKPIMVGTPNKQKWWVADGKIRTVEEELNK